MAITIHLSYMTLPNTSHGQPRYEIRDIQPPESVVKAMHSQVSAERQKRALILESEGARQSAINRAEGDKQATILASEADRQDKINKAVGEAEAVLQKARANAAAIALLGSAIRESNGPDAVSLMVAERYLDAFRGLAKEANTLLLPTNVADPAAMIASSLGIYRQLSSFNRMAKTDSVVQ
jgi:regulator of protease activity HflC (stomatin/prohibitin superfamily)